MRKILLACLAILIFFPLLAGSALAESYYTGSNYNYPGTCGGVISRDLSIGSRGTDVSTLQAFLVSQNYPGGGAWMITGYFGRATQAALMLYQQQAGLPATGIADSTTRNAIANCGTNPNPNLYPNPNPYGYTYISQQVTLSSLSPNTTSPGSAVTVNGSGFDYSNNTVYVGQYSIANVPSYNGTSLAFTVPSYVSGSPEQVYVSNSHGSSNTLSLYLSNPNQGQCGQYGYPNCNNCYGSYGYGNTYGCQSQVYLNYLNPTSGTVGQTVSAYGSGFSYSGNSVRFGSGVIANLYSTDGTSVSFTVPSQISGYGNVPITTGTYTVSVMNASGQVSNGVPFSVTSTGQYGNGAQITNVSGPNTVNTGTTGTWSVTVSSPQYSNTTLSVNWGDQSYGATPSSQQTQLVQGTQTFTFTHAYSQQGAYTVTFTASNGYSQQSNASATVTVYGSGTGYPGTVSISSLSPATSGRVGTQIYIQGSGFTSDNTVHFGQGGTLHLPSYNGTAIYYTIPYQVSACDLIGYSCGALTQQVTPGTYQLYVTNSNGTSNTTTFIVTQ